MRHSAAEIKRNGERCYVVISLIVIYEILRGGTGLRDAISIIHVVHREICGEQSPNMGGGGCRCGQMANASCERAQLQDVIARVTRLTDFAKLWEWERKPDK